MCWNIARQQWLEHEMHAVSVLKFALAGSAGSILDMRSLDAIGKNAQPAQPYPQLRVQASQTAGIDRLHGRSRRNRRQRIFQPPGDT